TAAEDADAQPRGVPSEPLELADERRDRGHRARTLVFVRRAVGAAPAGADPQRADRAAFDDHTPAGPSRLEPEARARPAGVALDPCAAGGAAELLVRHDEHHDAADAVNTQPRSGRER